MEINAVMTCATRVAMKAGREATAVTGARRPKTGCDRERKKKTPDRWGPRIREMEGAANIRLVGPDRQRHKERGARG